MHCARQTPPRTTRARMHSGSRWSPAVTPATAPLVVEPASKSAGRSDPAGCCVSIDDAKDTALDPLTVASGSAFADPLAMVPLVGRRLGQYLILQKIGAGGMGEVY